MENPSGRRFPESLRLTISLDGEPLPGGWVVVTIHTLHKNDFHCEFGPAGSAGRIFIDHDHLLRRALAEMETGLMDYKHPEGDWTGDLTVEPVDRRLIAQFRRGYAIWGGVGSDLFPSNYLELLSVLDGASSRTLMLLSVRVDVEPSETPVWLPGFARPD